VKVNLVELKHNLDQCHFITKSEEYKHFSEMVHDL